MLATNVTPRGLDRLQVAGREKPWRGHVAPLGIGIDEHIGERREPRQPSRCTHCVNGIVELEQRSWPSPPRRTGRGPRYRGCEREPVQRHRASRRVRPEAHVRDPRAGTGARSGDLSFAPWHSQHRYHTGIIRPARAHRRAGVRCAAFSCILPAAGPPRPADGTRGESDGPHAAGRIRECARRRARGV